MVGREFRSTQVAFTLARASDPREFGRFFGCPVEFSGSADRFSLSNATLAIPLNTRDQHLLETLRPVCDEAANERNTAYGTLRSSVENEVQKLLPHGKANRQRVANALGLTERTLSQKLGEENTATTMSSIACDEASRSNTSRRRAFRLRKLPGYSAMKDRPPSIAPSRAGRADRR
jgi:hypothetical protein